ncbi:hypothetical protein [Sulfuricurvum sp.]|uniref:hypothetical protein n=1 Tax=Sulfuricurvum sp. TaxID=2025608 RepID=UPI0035678FAF
MNPFDMQMIAMSTLALFLILFMRYIDKRFNYAMAGILAVIVLVWGEDVCSRKDRLNFYTTHFDKGGEIICKDDNANPLLISQQTKWERKGPYLFHNTKGIELMRDSCEIIGQEEPHCIQTRWLILSGIAAFVWFIGWLIVIGRDSETEAQKRRNAREERKDKIRTGANEMAELYKSDPELKELNEFVGDYNELPDESNIQENQHV